MGGNRAFNYYWGAVLLLLPFYIRTAPVIVDIRISKDILFLYCGLTSLAMFGIPKINSVFKSIVGILFAIAFTNQYFFASSAVLYQSISLAVGALVAIQFVSYAGKSSTKFYLNIFATTCIIQSSWVILNKIGVDPYRIALDIIHGSITKSGFKGGAPDPISISVSGPFMNSFVTAGAVAILLPSLYRKMWRSFLPVPILALFYLNSATGAIAAAASISVFAIETLIKKTRHKLAIYISSVAMFTVFYLLFLEDHAFFSNNGRFEPWAVALKLNSGLEILWGKGLGFIADNFSRIHHSIHPFKHIHNEFLEAYAAFGLIGVTTLTMLALVVLKMRKNAVLFSMMSSFFIVMLTGFPLHISSTALVGIVIYTLSIKQGAFHGIDSNKSKRF